MLSFLFSEFQCNKEKISMNKIEKSSMLPSNVRKKFKLF